MRKLHAALLFKSCAQHKWLHLGYVPFECLDELCDEIHENLQIRWNTATELLKANKTCFNHLIPVGRTNEVFCWIVSPKQEWDCMETFFLYSYFSVVSNCAPSMNSNISHKIIQIPNYLSSGWHMNFTPPFINRGTYWRGTSKKKGLFLKYCTL